MFLLKKSYCIEIKFPTNGQYPEQMLSICKDVKFLEELVSIGFSESYALVFANDPLFYTNKGDEGIYKMFRKDKKIQGVISKPTGQKDYSLEMKNMYSINWMTLGGSLKCFYIKVN